MQSAILVSTVFGLVLAIHFSFSKAQDSADDKNVASTIGRGLIFGINKLLLPYLNVFISTFFAAFIRMITVSTFGLSTMRSVVGSEGYLFYGYNFLKNYIGFQPIYNIFTGRLPF